MKNANGFGSVYKMSGRRRRPYRAVVTTGRTPEGKQIRQTLGYYETKKEALTALGVYNASPYSLERLRFEDIYKMWLEEKAKEIGPESFRGYSSAFWHSEPLHRKVFNELRTIDLQNCIRNSKATPSTQERMRLLYSQMYKYALRFDLAQRNYAVEIKIDPKEETSKRNPFSDKEIEKLWDFIKTPHDRKGVDECARMVLVGIYSGWRPTELCTYTLEGDLMRGGVKTKSGKNRLVPVHPLIKDLVKLERIPYNTYAHRFIVLMELLGIKGHGPHDTRRTFASLAASWRMDENIRKLIMGHRNADLTERVYTTHTINELRHEMAKIGRIRASFSE